MPNGGVELGDGGGGVGGRGLQEDGRKIYDLVNVINEIFVLFHPSTNIFIVTEPYSFRFHLFLSVLMS